MKRPAISVLLGINLALLALLIWLWVTPAGQLKNSIWTPPAPQKVDYLQMLPPMPGVVSVDTSKFVAMLDRPLFMLTRRPPPPPPPPDAPAPVDTLSTARIFGVFSGAGGGGVIINIGGKDRRVRLNESIDGGWMLQSISGTTVTFSGAGQTRSMTLPRAALTSYSGLPISQPPQPPAQPRIEPAPQVPQPRQAPAVDGGASRTSPAANAPDPQRATFGGRT